MLFRSALPEGDTFPVIIEKDYIVGKLVEELSGESIARGSSLFKDMIGEVKFNEQFTFGQKINEDCYNLPFYDAEGVVNENYCVNLIEKGKIVRPFADKKTARVHGFERTGSSVSTYDGVPTLGMPDITIEETGKTLVELLNGQVGIFVIMASGGDFTPEGNFGYPVQHAILTDGKEMLGRLPLINISSNLYDMFGKDFRGCTSDKILCNQHVVVADMKVSLG